MLEMDVLLSKTSIVKNCLRTIRRVVNDLHGLDAYLVEDLVILNLQRSIQAGIDMAHVVIAAKGFKLPATYKESFRILARERVIGEALAENMVKLVGFRNVSVHDYQAVSHPIALSIASHHLTTLEELCSTIIAWGEKELSQ